MYYTSDYERAIVHPTTAQWLDEHGYEYDHEPLIKGYYKGQRNCGRPDFLAWHEDSDCMLIIDCKPDGILSNAVAQMQKYQRAVGERSVKIIVIPVENLSEFNNRIFSPHRIFFLGLKMPISKRDYERNGRRHLNESATFVADEYLGRWRLLA